jgi:glycine oxidase
MKIHTDILIIGGGISGLLTARELRLTGREVAIIDKSASGRESSWAGGGILLPIYPWRQPTAISTLVMQSLSKYPDLNQELLQATGVDPQWRQSGMLICKNPDFASAAQWCKQYGVPAGTVPQVLIDKLHTTFEQPLWLPEIAQIRNPRLLKSLYAYLVQLGVKFFENVDISHFHSRGRNIDWLETGHDQYSFDELILCGGAWTAEFLQQHLQTLPSLSGLPIAPVKGQMLVFEASTNTLPHMVLDGDHYLIPREDGQILAGSTVETTGFDKSTTEQAKSALYEFATDLLPELKQYPLSHHWAGLRPGTPQGIPYIGRHPDFDNLSINAGHFRNGLVMGPASAQLLADQLLDRPVSVDPAPYAICRKNDS